MEKNLPNDPVMLLSIVNTRLRDFYPTLDAFCMAHEVSKEELLDKLDAIDYRYDIETNQFI